MKIRILTGFAFLLCLVSCSEPDKYGNVDSFGWKDFKEEVCLQGHVLDFDSLVMRPKGIAVHDSVLALIEPRSEKLLHLYNLNDRSKIGSYIDFGQGPHDVFICV